MRGERGGRILVYEGFRFRFHRHNAAGLMLWRCSHRRNCSCILTTNAFDKEAPNPVIQVINGSEHSGHPCQAEFIHNVRLREDMRLEAINDPTRPLKRIYDAIVAREHRQAVQGGGDRPQVPAFESVRSTIRRARSMVVPEIPASINDVRIEGTWTETWNRDNFLLHLDHYWGFAIFATEENLQALRNSRVLYMDGTFRSCPQPYTQVFTILGNVRGFVVPLVTALMVNKTTGIYRRVLQEVITAVRRVTHHNWRPHTIVADFEVALWNAVQTELPNAAMAGCHFHLTQSFWRRIQELGLARHYRNNQPLQNTIRKVMAIGYLPIPLLRNNFHMLMQSRTARRLMDEFPGLLEFFNYVNNTYILPRANFPPAVWNVHNRDMSQRTNNHAESKYSTRVGGCVHACIQLLIVFQCAVSAGMRVSIRLHACQCMCACVTVCVYVCVSVCTCWCCGRRCVCLV